MEARNRSRKEGKEGSTRERGTEGNSEERIREGGIRAIMLN